MDRVQWKVVTVTESEAPGQPGVHVWTVQLQAVPGGSVRQGQLVVGLSAPPAYHPGDVIDYPPAAGSPAPTAPAPAKPK